MGVAQHWSLRAASPLLYNGKRSKGHGVQAEKQRSQFIVLQDVGQNSVDIHRPILKITILNQKTTPLPGLSFISLLGSTWSNRQNIRLYIACLHAWCENLDKIYQESFQAPVMIGMLLT